MLCLYHTKILSEPQSPFSQIAVIISLCPFPGNGSAQGKKYFFSWSPLRQDFFYFMLQ